jgi:peptide/nickel transport system permease protein
VRRVVGRQLLQLFLALFGASLIVFISVRLSGDPVHFFLPENAGPELEAAYRTRLGLDRPLVAQYYDFVGRLVRADLGYSFRHNVPVRTLILERLSTTLALAGASLGTAVAIAIPLGVAAAAHRGSTVDQAVQILGAIGQSMPVYWSGLLLIIFVALPTGWFPTGGGGSLRHMVLPTATLAAFLIARFMRLTRSSMLECLGEDYVRTARGKGLSGGAVLYRHALRNALIPVLTLIGLQMGTLLGGTVVIETIFALPGLGALVVQGIYGRDFPVVQATVILLAAMFMVITSCLDLLYGWLDPRIRYR